MTHASLELVHKYPVWGSNTNVDGSANATLMMPPAGTLREVLSA